MPLGPRLALGKAPQTLARPSKSHAWSLRASRRRAGGWQGLACCSVHATHRCTVEAQEPESALRRKKHSFAVCSQRPRAVFLQSAPRQNSGALWMTACPHGNFFPSSGHFSLSSPSIKQDPWGGSVHGRLSLRLVEAPTLRVPKPP
jgi:hypothetical protein